MTQLELETLTAVKQAAKTINTSLPQLVNELVKLNKTLTQFLEL